MGRSAICDLRSDDRKQFFETLHTTYMIAPQGVTSDTFINFSHWVPMNEHISVPENGDDQLTVRMSGRYVTVTATNRSQVK